MLEPTPAFRSKNEEVQRLITEAIDALTILGIPFDGITWRGIERIAMAFLATGQVNTAGGWENIKDLKLLVIGEVVLRTNENLARNDPSRGYDINPAITTYLRSVGLYVGDTADKFLFRNEVKLKELNFFELSHSELPDIVAYSSSKNWLYLIEAVHSSGPISENRLLELKRLTKDCIADIVYITAFLNRAKFRSWVKKIAWETEVWIAETPDHLVHFNGVKFLGPYINKEPS